MTNRRRGRGKNQKNSQVRNIEEKSPNLNIKQIIELASEFRPNLDPIRGYEKSHTDAKVITERGLQCKIERNWLGIKCDGGKLLALSPEGNLFLYEISSGCIKHSTPTGKPLHVSHGSSVPLAAIRELYKHAKGSELADLNCNASDLVGISDVYIVPSKSETVFHVNQRTGQLTSATNSVNDEILCIKRFDFEITCYKENTNTICGYRRITSIHVSEVSRSGPRFCEKNDALARMGQTLVKPGTVGKISWSNRVIGEGDKDTVLVEGEIQKRAVIVRVKKGQSLDVKKVSKVIDVCGANPNFVNVYAVEKDGVCSYVATEHCDTSLREFIQSSHNLKSQHLKDCDKLLKLIWGIVTAIACLHYNGISHGKIHIDNIFVDKYSRAKIRVIGKGWSIRDTSKDRFSLSKEAADDMYGLGNVIYFCLTGVEYKGENLYSSNHKKYLEKIYDCPDALHLLKELLHHNDETQRVTALQASNHTLFWSSSKRLRFIRAVAERLELKECTLLSVINSINETVFNKRWDKNLPKDFVNVMTNERDKITNNDSSYGLLRIIRNLIAHEMKIRNDSRIIQSKDKEVQEMFGPAGFESYFRKRFPNLVNEVHNAMRKYLGEEPKFQQFYKKIHCNF